MNRKMILRMPAFLYSVRKNLKPHIHQVYSDIHFENLRKMFQRFASIKDLFANAWLVKLGDYLIEVKTLRNILFGNEKLQKNSEEEFLFYNDLLKSLKIKKTRKNKTVISKFYKILKVLKESLLSQSKETLTANKPEEVKKILVKNFHFYCEHKEMGEKTVIRAGWKE